MISRLALYTSIGVMVCSLQGCATKNPHPQDPLEGLNREIYGFNRAVDKGLVRPVAYGYYQYTPKQLQAGVNNFFSNFKTIRTVMNDLLQAKFGYAVHDTARFLINTTVGIGGLFDPAHRLGLSRRFEDFGQTLHVWGWENSTYLMLPIIGPSTVRDTVGMAVDSTANFFNYVEDDRARWALLGLYGIDTRANLLRNEKVLESIGIDEYSLIRNAYLEQHNFDTFDGNVPVEKQDSDPFEEEWLEKEPVQS